MVGAANQQLRKNHRPLRVRQEEGEAHASPDEHVQQIAQVGNMPRSMPADRPAC